jgi:hypothetical protein
MSLQNYVKISDGNIKLGKGIIYSVSLTPGESCKPGVPCFKPAKQGGGCYCAKAMRLYPTVRAAWGFNLDMAKNMPDKYFGGIEEYIKEKSVKFFRFHVSGDIPSQDYFRSMLITAFDCPDTKFLCFTKRDDILTKSLKAKAHLPRNMKLIYSVWPGVELPDRSKMYYNGEPIPFAWVLDHKNPDPRIPEDALICPGKCDLCFMCWDARHDIVFPKH